GEFYVTIERLKGEFATCSEIAVCEYDKEENEEQNKYNKNYASKKSLTIDNVKFNESKTVVELNASSENDEEVEISIYDISGRMTEKLYNGMIQKGKSKMLFNLPSEEIKSGVYFFTISNGDEISCKRVTILK
ncbi:MAG: T9SS type A sorting domain-containing protein, partial [bacterium]|nr:T9SS type A sorting domain-containing protein [bacterium]